MADAKYLIIKCEDSKYGGKIYSLHAGETGYSFVDDSPSLNEITEMVHDWLVENTE